MSTKTNFVYEEKIHPLKHIQSLITEAKKNTNTDIIRTELYSESILMLSNYITTVYKRDNRNDNSTIKNIIKELKQLRPIIDRRNSLREFADLNQIEISVYNNPIELQIRKRDISITEIENLFKQKNKCFLICC